MMILCVSVSLFSTSLFKVLNLHLRLRSSLSAKLTLAQKFDRRKINVEKVKDLFQNVLNFQLIMQGIEIDTCIHSKSS